MAEPRLAVKEVTSSFLLPYESEKRLASILFDLEKIYRIEKHASLQDIKEGFGLFGFVKTALLRDRK